MTIHTTDTSLVLDTKKAPTSYAVFEHLAVLHPGSPPEVIYVGYEKLVDVYKMIGARQNSEWRRIYEGGGSVMVRIVAVCDTRAEAGKYSIAHINTFPVVPRCNKYGITHKGMQRPIVCSNGEVYRGQKQASEILGIQQSAISRHLRGELTTAGGFTFRFYTQEDARNGLTPSA